MRRRSRSHLPAVLVLTLVVAVTLILMSGCSAGTNESFEGAAPGETTGPAGTLCEKITGSPNMCYTP